MRLADAERIEQPDRVVGPHLEVVVLLGLVGLPVAAHVVVDTAELAAEQRRHRSEVEVAEARAVDLDDRLALAGDLVPQARPVHLDEIASHASLLSTARRRRKYMSDIRCGSGSQPHAGHTGGAGESRTLDLPMMTLPLADVRIIAVEQYGAGPWGTLQLADLGAEVIKIEDPQSGGDVGRYVPPFQEGEDSLFFETFNRNKKSVSLDLRSPSGREVFEDMVAKSDAVYSNLRGDQPAKLRLTYDDLKDVNPRIVCCSLSGFGMSGERAAQGGYDYMMQGLAGWMSLTGDPDGPPTKSGLSLVDLSGGYASAIAVLAGLWRARRDGVGCDCDVSLLGTAQHELMYVGTWAASRGYAPPRRRNSAHPSIVPFQNFETADGWIVVACPKEKFWVLLCDAIGRPDLAEEFPTFADRDRRRDELSPILDQAFR